MKKRMVVILAAALAAAAVMTGCGKNGKNEEGSAGSSAGAEKDVQISAEELLKATDYNVEDYVTLNDYFGMDVEVSGDYDVTDDDVKQYTEQMLAYYPAYEKTDKETVEDKDIVNIDYEGKVDGEVFDGGSAEGAHLEIGSDSFIDGFEDGLIGKKVGETVDLNLKFPDPYQNNEDLSGKDVVFTVTVNSIDKEKVMTYDTLTDEYIASNFSTSGITTVDQFTDQIRSTIESSNEQQKEADTQTAVLEKLESECTVKFPEGLTEQRMTESVESIKKQLVSGDTTFEDAVGMTEEEYRREMMEQLEKNLKQELILEAIVQKENISISSSEFTSFVQNYSAYYGLESEEAFYEQFGEEDTIKLSYAENQALRQVVEKANVTVKAPEAQDSAETEDKTESGQ